MKKLLSFALTLILLLSTTAGFAEEKSDWTSYLLIGLDVKPRDLGVVSDWSYLADMLMIVSVNASAHRYKVTALDCDIPVSIDGKETYGIGTAYYFGGPELMMQTVNEVYGLSIERYVVMDPRKMADVIDEIGGVKISLTKAERDATNRYVKAVFGAQPIKDYGKDVLLTGPQAVSYGSSWDVNPAQESRVGREFAVLLAYFHALKGLGLADATGLVAAILRDIQTNFGLTELSALLQLADGADFSGIEYMQVSHTDDRDPQIDKTLIDEFIHLDSPYPVVFVGSDDAEAIKILQQKLNQNGASLTVDGDFGAKTRAALLVYQEANGLVASGVCGYGTWNALIGD